MRTVGAKPCSARCRARACWIAAAHAMPSSGCAEGHEEPVASVLHLLAAPARELGAQGAVVPAQQLLPDVVAHRLGQSGRLHDVGEEEGADGSRGGLVARRSDVEVDHRTDLLCRTGGGLDLEASAGLVAICHQRAGQPHARLGGFVGSVDLAPGADAFLQRADGCRGVATVEGQLATRRPRRPRPDRACRTVAPAPRARRRSRWPPAHRRPPGTRSRAPAARRPGAPAPGTPGRPGHGRGSALRPARRPAPGAGGPARAGRRHRRPPPAASASSAPARSPRRTRMSTSSL